MENPSSLEHKTPEVPSVAPSIDGVQRENHVITPEVLDHAEAEEKADATEEELKSTLEIVATTGKFWLDWEKLKEMLSCWLKKVLSEYPEGKITVEQQKEALGETYSELISRLDEALLSFVEGPPFTLQRLCEILLSARSIYPKLSKLALALEKNLLVTSMLSISTEPEAHATEDPNADTKMNGVHLIPNGVEAMEGGDKDEIMTEVEEADVDDAMTIDMETIDEPPETMTTTSNESETPSENTVEQPATESMAAEESMATEEGDSRLP